MSITNPVPSQEYALIEKIKKRCGIPSKQYKLAIGDDCAVRSKSDSDTLISTDTMVENVHFRLDLMTLEEVGFKAITSSISDIFAMGGTSESVFIQLVFPKSDSAESQIIELYDGIHDALTQFNCSVTGGDIASGPCWVIAVTVIGVAGERVLYRSDAQEGDSIWVTGTPGLSGLGLDLLLSEGRTRAEVINSEAVRAHTTPLPRSSIMNYIQNSTEIHALIDISDGVGKEILTIGQESSLSAEIFLPESIMTMLEISGDHKDSPLQVRSPKELFLSGGEDYELLFTAENGFVPQFDGVPFTKIGVMTNKSNSYFIDGETREELSGGWDHL